MSLRVCRKAVVALLIVLFAVFALAGCGGGSKSSSSNSNSTQPVANIMGGAVQGKALELTGTASTFAGFSAETRTQFDQAYAIVVDGGYLYVGDGTTLLKITIATGEVATLAGSRDVSGYDDGVGAGARFWGITAMTGNGADLYVVDGCAIRKVTKATGAVTTVAGRGGEPGANDGAGLDARFEWPAAMTTDGANLYVADGNATIRKLVLGTGEVTTIAGSPGMYGTADGTGSAARFYGLDGITVLGGNLYVSDYLSIRKIEIAQGAVTTVANLGANLFGLVNDGNFLYVSEWRSVNRVDPATGEVTPLAGNENAARMNFDATGTAARFLWARAVATDGANIYVADPFGRSVRKVVIATGAVTTVVRGKSSMGWADGPADAARFALPWDITTDGTSLFVADSNTIRKVAIATGEVRTLAGNPLSVFGVLSDGVGGAATFNFPSAITYDGKNVYVVDAYGAIRKVTPDKGEVTTVTADVGGVIAGITSDATNLYLSMPYEHAIWKMSIATGAVTVLAKDGTGVGADIGSPSGITTDGTNLYAIDRDSAVKKIELATGMVSVLYAAQPYELNCQGITTDGTNLYFDRNGRIARMVIATGAVTAIGNRGSAPSGMTTDGNRLYMLTGDNTIRVMR